MKTFQGQFDRIDTCGLVEVGARVGGCSGIAVATGMREAGPSASAAASRLDKRA